MPSGEVFPFGAQTDPAKGGGGPFQPIIQAADPGPVGAGRFWLTLAGVLSVRNSANTGWISLATGTVVPTAGDTVVGPDDYGDPADPGVSDDYSRADHDHGLPTAPGGLLDYVEFAAPVSVTGGNEGAANTVVTSGSVACDGTHAIEVTFFAPGLNPQPTANAALIVMLYEDATLLGYIASARTPAAAQLRVPCTASVKRTPAAGSHVYTVKAFTTSGTASIDAGAGGTGDYVAGYVKVTAVA